MGNLLPTVVGGFRRCSCERKRKTMLRITDAGQDNLCSLLLLQISSRLDKALYGRFKAVLQGFLTYKCVQRFHAQNSVAVFGLCNKIVW